MFLFFAKKMKNLFVLWEHFSFSRPIHCLWNFVFMIKQQIIWWMFFTVWHWGPVKFTYLQEFINFNLSIFVEVHLIKDFMERIFIDLDIDVLQRNTSIGPVKQSIKEDRCRERKKERLTSKTRWTSTVVMNPLFSLSNLWNRFLYLPDRWSVSPLYPNLQHSWNLKVTGNDPWQLT